MSFSYSTLAGLKSLAKSIQAERGVPRHEALDLAARAGGFQCFAEAARKLPSARPTGHVAHVRQTWWGYESKDGGTAAIAVPLGAPLAEMLRPHHLTGYLGACKLRANNVLERSGQQRDAGETQWYIGRIARVLQFMSATGLRPSAARRCYPDGDWDNRPPVADHDHCWFDPAARVHVLSTEPYPGRAEREEGAQRLWEQRHGWTTLRARWGGIYGNGTELILCCPASYAETLRRKLAALERSPAALRDEEVAIESYSAIPRPVVMVD